MADNVAEGNSQDSADLEKLAHHLAKEILPRILLTLLEEGEIDEARLEDPKYVLSLVPLAPKWLSEISAMKVVGDIREEFMETARGAVASGNTCVAVVLVATVLEHEVNYFYRGLLASRLSDADLVELFKRNDFPDKLGWLLRLTSGCDIEDSLRNQVRQLVDTRNSLVHYKWVPYSVSDPTKDYLANLDNQIARTGLQNILELPEQLRAALDSILCKVDPRIETARSLSYIVNEWYGPESQKPSTQVLARHIMEFAEKRKGKGKLSTA